MVEETFKRLPDEFKDIINRFDKFINGN